MRFSHQLKPLSFHLRNSNSVASSLSSLLTVRPLPNRISFCTLLIATPAGVPIAELQPRYNPLEDLLFFSHIPRTAGGTFSVLLSALFPTQEQVPHSGTGSAVRDLTAYKSMTAEQWRDMRVLFAHEDLSFVKLIPKHVAVTVFLRDPIKVLQPSACCSPPSYSCAVLTLTQHRRSSYYWGLLHPFRSYDDITSWVLSPDFPTLYQVEWMAGVSRWWPYSHYSEDYSLRIWHNKPLMMRLAKENLAQTTWFGITERFNESICLFYYTHRLVPKEEGKDYRSIHRHVTQGAGEEVGVVTAAQYQKPRLGCGSPPAHQPTAVLVRGINSPS